MPRNLTAARFKRFASADKTHPAFALVDADDSVLLDVSVADDGGLEVAVTDALARSTVSLDQLLIRLAEGRRLVVDEMRGRERARGASSC